jgi:hypothetical protein
MATVILYCKDTPGLKLGPGVIGDPRTGNQVIVFENGYADVAEDDPLFAAKMSWLNGPGCPLIKVVDGSVDAPAPFDPRDIACPETVETSENLTGTIHEVRGTAPCPARFKTQKEADQHQLRAHRPTKKGTQP